MSEFSTNQWRHSFFWHDVDVRFYRAALDHSNDVYDIDGFSNNGYV